MPRAVALLSLLLVLLGAAPGWAVFHISAIDEIMSGLNGDATAQYVEIKMLADAQIAVAHTRLTAFNCDGSTSNVLLELPQDLCTGGAGWRWSMGTSSWAAATGVTPDFPFSPGLFAPCGQICWGAPGIVPPNPATWDATDPNNYVDCVAYGGYTGPRQTSDSTASTLPPGDGTMSLQRMGDTGDDLADFALAARTPANDGCVTTTTTTLPHGGGGACKDFAGVANTRMQVAAQCDCAGAANHGTYVKCAAAVAKAAAAVGLLPKACKGAVKRCAAMSTCGKPGFVTCCRTKADGGRACRIKRRAAACKVPKGGTACVGDVPSCCDACGATTCATVTTTTTAGATSTTAPTCVQRGGSCTTSAQCCSHYCYVDHCY